MPAEAGIGAIHGSAVLAKQASLQGAVQKLSLQQAKYGSTPQPCSTKAAVELTSVSSLPEPSAPTVCTSPRLKQQPAKLDSRAALQAKSPFAQRSAKRLTGQDTLRKSADAILTSAKSSGGGPKLAARHMQKQSSLEKKADPAASSQEGVAAAVRRSRVLYHSVILHLLRSLCCILAEAFYLYQNLLLL